MNRPILFIADLHLCPERPQINAAFFALLAHEARAAKALYILGDFFEAWVGDDDLSAPLPAEVAAALKALVAAGTAVYVMVGNRDFLLGGRFAAASDVQLLTDPTQIDLYGIPTLLLHGDSLCLDDVAYQSFRQRVRNPQWQAAFLQKPLAERHAMARALRDKSEQTKADKTPDIMDVTPAAVENALRDRGCRQMIHGHTHRPAEHVLRVGGQTCTRWVLPDWYHRIGWLHCDATGCRLELRSLSPADL